MEQTTVGDAVREVLPRQRDAEFVLYSLLPDDSLATALRKLSGFKVSGAPVLEDRSAQAFRSARMVDLNDLALAIVESCGNRQVFDMPVSRIAGEGLAFVYDDALLAEGVRALVKSNTKRLLVLDQATDGPIAVLSQSGVVAWVLRHIKHLPSDLLAKPISQLKCSSHVVAVKRDEPMADALRKFVGEGRSGVAVVEDSGRIVANLSLADLRRLTPENAMELLRLSVGAFLSSTQELPKDPVTCTYNTTFAEVLHLLHSRHVHRVYVTDQQGLPVGVFSTTDAMANLCP
jgi:CBS domain-containing protein